MNFINEEAGIVLKTRGAGPRAEAVFESLGYKSEGQMAKKKAAKTMAKINAGVSKAMGAVSKACESITPTRNALMLEVKAKGIKNFRVMNKAELAMIVGGATVPQIEAIQLAAVTRWKSGQKKTSVAS